MARPSGLSEGEQMVLMLHPHWKTLLRPFLVLALIIAATLLLVLFLPAGTPALARLIIGAAALVAIAIWFGLPVLRWQSTLYELTNRRLRLRTGVITRSGRDFPLNRISDVSFQQGPLDRLLRCGRLIVESPGEHGQLVLNEIPQVRDVQATMFQLVGDEQARLARDDRYT
jgi:uncharacterized membrane protein YdbT with pleckstrin-like domain